MILWISAEDKDAARWEFGQAKFCAVTHNPGMRHIIDRVVHHHKAVQARYLLLVLPISALVVWVHPECGCHMQPSNLSWNIKNSSLTNVVRHYVAVECGSDHKPDRP